jgi:hypothetical protein
VPPGDIDRADVRGADVVPVQVAGLPVMELAEALEVRDRPGDDTEIAIRGRLQWPDPNVVYDCVASTPPTILIEGCVGEVDDPRLVHETGIDSIHLVNPTPIQQPERDVAGVTVVVVGHFDDRRASACGPWRTTCEAAFVVDAIWFDGRLGTGAWEWGLDDVGPPPRATRDLVNRTVRSIVPGPDPKVLAVGSIRGPDLPFLEPATAGTSLAAEPWVWHITVLVDDRAQTLLITDDDLLARLEVGGDWTVWEVSGDTLTGTGVDIN